MIMKVMKILVLLLLMMNVWKCEIQWLLIIMNKWYY